MRLKFQDIINSKKNKPVLILGSSPNLYNFPFKSFKGEIMALGDTITRGRNLFNANYWIAANNEYPIPQIDLHAKILNKNSNTKFFFSHTAAYDNFWRFSPSTINNLIKNDWLNFDDRHINYKECSPKKKCCEYISINKYEKSIQEIFMDHFNTNFKFIKGATVAEFALIFSMLMGFNPIFIQGVELPIFKKDYVHYKCEYSDKIHVQTKKIMRRKYLLKYTKDLSIIKFIMKRLKEIKINNKIHDDLEIYNSKLGKKSIKKSSKSIFYEKISDSLRNFNIYSDIGKKNKIKIFNLSKISSLNNVKNIKFLDPDELKLKFNNFFS